MPAVPNTREFIRYISASDNLLIVTGGLATRKIDIQLIDMNGRVVHRETKAYQTTTISLQKFPRGSYILRIVGDKKELFTQQFIRK